jgi:hypothetical protein
MKSPIGYALAYLALMVPTYVMPYLGSNSALINAVSAGVGAGLSPLWWAHLWCLGLLVVLAYARGPWVGRKTLWVFPLVGAAFDLMPGLNWVPFVPTAMHLWALIAGTRSKTTEADTPDPNASTDAPQTPRGVAIGAAVISVVAAVGIAVSLSGMKKVAAAATGKTPSQPAAPQASSAPKVQNPPDQATSTNVSKTSGVTKPPTDNPKPAQRPDKAPQQKPKEGGTVQGGKEAPPPKAVRYIDLNQH